MVKSVANKAKDNISCHIPVEGKILLAVQDILKLTFLYSQKKVYLSSSSCWTTLSHAQAGFCTVWRDDLLYLLHSVRISHSCRDHFTLKHPCEQPYCMRTVRFTQLHGTLIGPLKMSEWGVYFHAGNVVRWAKKLWL